MYIVVGSGPAGVSTATALLKKDYEVVMLDAGVSLESDLQKELSSAKQQQSTQWSSEFLEKIKGPMMGWKDPPTKLLYGSRYPYEGFDDRCELSARNASCQPSFARGGLSNVWGAAVLPYRSDDMGAWPFDRKELDPYYEKVLEFMPLTGIKDNLASKFPFFTNTVMKYRPSKQAKMLLSTWQRHSQTLEKKGLLSGCSRLGVQSQGRNPCAYCGLCMFGCPYELIYSSAHTLKKLLDHSKFTYIPDTIVTKVVESKEGVKVRAVGRVSKKEKDFMADRVFLAGGVVPTGTIMLDSTNITELTIKDSQYIIIPSFSFRRVKDVENEGLHTLAQAFIEVDDLEGSIHLQVYTYNELFRESLKARLGPLYPLTKWFVSWFLDHMIVLQGFLHSDVSAQVIMKRKNKAVTLSGKDNPRTARVLGRLKKKLLFTARELGFVILVPLMRKELPGKSFHFGGTFPMSKKPISPTESDLLGRPKGFSRVHITDASVLPSIPGTTITFSVMANAYRIADQHDGVSS